MPGSKGTKEEFVDTKEKATGADEDGPPDLIEVNPITWGKAEEILESTK